MKKKRDALERIARLQSKLHDLNVWRLTAAEQKRAALETAQREMVEAIGRDALAHGRLAAAATRSLRGIDTQLVNAKAKQAAQQRAALDQAARAKMSERALEKADANYRADRERAELGELIERSLRPSSPA
jgi:hypothetical protein